MQQLRPYVLSIAGFDPTGGAGVLADCKTFEQNGVYGLSVITANTIQTDNCFLAPNWVDKSLIIQQTSLMLENYEVKCLKIGLIESYSLLKELIFLVKTIRPNVYIVWDPILKSSSGFGFHENKAFEIEFIENNIDLVTPNLPEFNELFGAGYIVEAQKRMSILKKGGHDQEKCGTDVLMSDGKSRTYEGNSFLGITKHGTGCILSSAICANIALNFTVEAACQKAKGFVEKAILSNESNLAYFTNL